MSSLTRRVRGFALLEALVAIVIVSSVGVALFALINTGLQNLEKAEAHAATTSLQPEILAWVRQQELAELPAQAEHEQQFAGSERSYTARARFERIHGPVMATTSSGSAGIHQIALYDVTVTLYDNNRRLQAIHTRRVASRQVAPPPSL